MPVKMEPHQLEFWRELLAPFAPHELSEVPARGGKKTLTYIDKRALENRLDSVCGPDGWYPEYEATARGYKCKLWIAVPSKTPGTTVFMAKEDGAGFEEMGSYNKQTNEWEADVDNDEKSGYTNALRRAAQDAWGIGRYLYGKGIPSFLDPNARPVTPADASAQHVAAHESMSGPREQAQRQAPAQPPRQQAPAQGQGEPKFDNFKIPRAGKQVFAWCKEMEKVFETKLLNGMQREGETRGWGTVFSDWTQEQVDAIVLGCMGFIRELPTYKGQFEHLFPGGQPAAKPEPGVKPGVNLADLRKTLMAKMQELVNKQTGRDAEPTELKSAFLKIASLAPNGDEQVGLQPESLAKLTDQVWIENMIRLVKEQIAMPASNDGGEAEGDSEIPF